MQIAYQGEPGAFSEAAARRVAPDAQLMPCRTFEEAFAPSRRGTAGYGVLPIENSIGGSIHRNYDLLLSHELPIVAEVELPVVHQLLALPGASLDRLRRVYSHPQALAQCERFLRTLTGVEIVATYDTAGSAKMVADERLENAARDRVGAGGRDLRPASLASSVQDYNDNVTRFLVIGRRPLHDRVPDKTSIVFSLPNEPGALFKALSAFALRGLDLTKLESRPLQGRPWEYLFYVDVAAARDEVPCARALAHLAEFAPTLRTLGSYASWKTREGCSPIRSRWCHDVCAESADDRAEPCARAGDAQGRRLHGRRSQEAAHRRRQYLDRNRTVQLPPARSGRAREGRHPRGRRHADGVQHGVDLRRHHDEHRGDEDLARQPRGHRRFDRAGHARQRLRRPHRAGRLRQDHSRRHHGAGAVEHPGLILYGGSIAPGQFHGKAVTIQEVFEAVGAHGAGKMSDADLHDSRAACPGAARAAASSRPTRWRSSASSSASPRSGSGNVPANDPKKAEVARGGGRAPDDARARRRPPARHHDATAFHNAIASVATTGGSTNAVLHLMAIAHEAGCRCRLNDFDRISASVPLLADLKPSGRFVATDLYAAGGTALVAKRLIEAGVLIDGDAPTVTGRTIGERPPRPSRRPGQEVVRPVGHPLKTTGGLVIVYGNLAPEGAVIKVSGTGRLEHRGPARVFDSEEAAFAAVQRQAIRPATSSSSATKDRAAVRACARCWA